MVAGLRMTLSISMDKADRENLENISRHIEMLLGGNQPALLKSAITPDSKIYQLVDSVNRLTLELQGLDRASYNLSSGDIVTPIDTTLAPSNNLKILQSNLKHFIWQISHVAQGDFSQRVDFGPVLSESFNEIVEQLKKTKKGNSVESYEIDDFPARDSLTGAGNRFYMFDFGKTEFARAQRYGNDFSIILLDVDCLKKINKTYGYQVGDEVLKALVTGFVEALRETDEVGRLAGEEFAVFLPETGIDAAEKVAERLREMVEVLKVFACSRVVHFTVSMGVSTMHPDDQGFEAIMERAGEALYLAKNGGKNRVVVEG
jgi:diguanylate cyclase (GGDEF)-like protein